MGLDLRLALPTLVPAAIAWTETLSAEILRQGIPLSAELQALAGSVGVRQPEAIRLWETEYLPMPEDAELRQAIFATGLLGANMSALSLGYGVVVRSGSNLSRLLGHNFRHVYQFEQAGSLAAFMTQYVQQVIEYGHEQAPLELDARAYGPDR